MACLFWKKQKTANDLRNIEAIIVLRILNNLGYIGESETLQNLVKSPFEQELIFEVSKSRMRSFERNQQSAKRNTSLKYLPR